MRMILATLLATAIATPAAAQYSGNRSNDQTVQQSMGSQTIKSKKARRGTGAFAQAPNANGQSAHDVYVNGNYVGSDPDPRVRETLRREARGETSGGGGDGGGAD